MFTVTDPLLVPIVIVVLVGNVDEEKLPVGGTSGAVPVPPVVPGKPPVLLVLSVPVPVPLGMPAPRFK